jgi:hypothetical protein
MHCRRTQTCLCSNTGGSASDNLPAISRDLMDGGCGMTRDQQQIARSKSDVSLGDGGIYDNLGLESVIRKFRMVLVSDAGQSLHYNPAPWCDYLLHAKDTMELIDHQVRILRKKQLTDVFTQSKDSDTRRDGVYWSIRGDPKAEFQQYASSADQPSKKPLKEARLSAREKNRDLADLAVEVSKWNRDRVQKLASVTTGLWALDKETVWELIDWGYVRTASAMANYYQHEDYMNGVEYNKYAPIKLPSQQAKETNGHK